jgi:hypothetical protein
VIGEACQLVEDLPGGVQQPVFGDLGVAEEFSQVLGLVLGEGDRFGGQWWSPFPGRLEWPCGAAPHGRGYQVLGGGV